MLKVQGWVLWVGNEREQRREFRKETISELGLEGYFKTEQTQGWKTANQIWGKRNRSFRPDHVKTVERDNGGSWQQG